MKNQQHEAARELFFNTNLSKTEIAERLNVTRRTIYQWSVDGDWEKLRQSARHMPAILAEKCYYLIGHFTDHLLSAESRDMPITKQEVDMLHKLTVIIGKLKRGTTVADNMETFTYFLERIQRTDPGLAEKVAPHVSDYIKARRGKDESAFLLSGFDETGHVPCSEKDLEEQRLDQQDEKALQTQSPVPAEPSAKQQNSQPPHANTNPNPKAPAPTPAPMPTPSNHKPKTHPNSNPKPNPPYRSHEPIRPVHTPLPPLYKKTPLTHAPAVAA